MHAQVNHHFCSRGFNIGWIGRVQDAPFLFSSCYDVQSFFEASWINAREAEVASLRRCHNLLKGALGPHHDLIAVRRILISGFLVPKSVIDVEKSCLQEQQYYLEM